RPRGAAGGSHRVNTRTVDPRTAWAVLAMEAALVLPLISLPAQGDRVPGLLGPLLLLVLLPAGCAAVYWFPNLRDPSWRLLTGIGLALLTRAVVSVVPDEGLSGLLAWLAHSFVPVVIGVGLWWRGGALAVSELTPADVRTEFSVLAICLVVVLALIRPFLLADQLLLGLSVGLFAVSGLIGMALSRQDAAEVAAPHPGRALAIATAITPPLVAVILVSFLRPELLDSMWLLVARGIELILTPVGLFLNWLASLLPRATPAPLPVPPPRPTPEPNPADSLAQAQDRLAWVGTVIVYTLLVVGGLVTLLAAKLLLSNFIRAPQTWLSAGLDEEVIAESSGTPGEEAGDLLGWLVRWLSALRGARGARGRGNPADEPAGDAWSVYRRLLIFADSQGLGRRPSETTGQLSVRLAREMPDIAPAVDVVTQAFESERYGGVAAPPERLSRAGAALTVIVERPSGR
ncbi:MAG TPA: DUF4129 domain-containing protein, partial [Chloroflexota bacterium]